MKFVNLDYYLKKALDVFYIEAIGQRRSRNNTVNICDNTFEKINRIFLSTNLKRNFFWECFYRSLHDKYGKGNVICIRNKSKIIKIIVQLS